MTTHIDHPERDAQLDLFDQAGAEERRQLLARLQTAFITYAHERWWAANREMRRRQAHVRYATIRRDLSARVIGHEELLSELSLIALMHEMGTGSPQRILICGPAGSGKSYLARMLAEVTRSPYFVQDAQMLQESGWRSLSLETMLEAWCRQEGGGLSAIERGILVIEEIGKTRVHKEATGNAVDKRRGAQMALLSLLGTGVPTTVGDEGRQLRSDRMLIVMTEAFSDSPWGNRAPTPKELQGYGMAAELIDRCTTVLYLPPQPAKLLARVYAEGPTSVSEAERVVAEQLGYTLEVDPGTYRYAAITVREGNIAVGQRAGGFWIAAAARRALARALRESLPPGSIVRVTPDDLEIPAAGKPRPEDSSGDWGPGGTSVG